MKITAAILFISISVPATAQESQIQAEFRHETESFTESCLHPPSFSVGSLGGCVQQLFTGHPLHIAVGSLAPQNGFGAGLALTTHYTPNESWRLFWDFDAVATANGSWRAGGYMTAAFMRRHAITTHTGTPAPAKSHLLVEDMPAFHAYAQTTSLNKLTFFGLGPNSSASGRSYFGLQETITGGNVVWPVFPQLHLSLLGEANGRFFSLRGNHSQSSPSIEKLYTETTAPGLSRQPSYAQFSEGFRLQPALANGYVRLNYSLAFQQWLASQSNYSFRRLTADLSHQFPLYSKTRSLIPREFNGPDSCSETATAQNCPAISRNLEGSFSLEFLYTASFVSNGNQVPFYTDPTLGGSDIEGTPYLPSYADYRFRAPNLLLIRGSFEHSIYKWPIGAKFLVDEGRVALDHGDLGFDHLAHSYAAGLTFHAGGLPVFNLLFAWGGHEGTHTIANLSTNLLGGTSRPSLY